MHFSTALLFSFWLALVKGVVANSPSQTSPLGLTTKHGKTTKRDVSSPFDKRQSCEGTCRTCFGSSYRECPDSERYCYDTDLGSASEQCSGSSGGTPTGSPSPEYTITNICTSGRSCVACFGPGYTACPSGSYYDCYDPSEFSQSEGCNKSGSGGSFSGGSSASPSPSSIGTSQSQCEEQYGSGSVPCGTRACYNPGEGEVCCDNGFHCPASTRCVPSGSVFQCEETDSSSDGVVSAPPSLGMLAIAVVALMGGVLGVVGFL